MLLKKIVLPTIATLIVLLFVLILLPKEKDEFSAEDLFGKKDVNSFNENTATVKLFKRTNKQGRMMETSEIILSNETQQKLTNSIMQSKFEKATTTYWNLDYTFILRAGDSVIIFYFDSVNKVLDVYMIDNERPVGNHYKIKDSSDDSDEFFTILEEFIR